MNSETSINGGITFRCASTEGRPGQETGKEGIPHERVLIPFALKGILSLLILTHGSTSFGCVHDAQHYVVNFVRQRFDVSLRVEIGNHPGPQSADECLALLLVHTDRTGEHKGYFDVFVQYLARIFGIADLDDLQRFPVEPLSLKRG